MFEEVPRSRRGLAGWSTRRIVLGPFAIGGGLLLATIGGSVAVAATVFTATSIVASDVPPKHVQQPVVVVSVSHPSHPGHSSSTSNIAGSSAKPAPSSLAGSTAADRSPSGPLTVTERQRTSSNALSTTAPASSGPASTATPTPTGTPTTSPSGPSGNAVVYISGYDQGNQRVLFEFATVTSGAGSGSGDQYTVSSQQQFSASLADDISITSGGQLCPPAGSSCTVAQLIAGAQTGFFAGVAIDAGAALHSVIELDNTSAAPQSSPSSSPSGSPVRSGIEQPTVSPSG
jgi:hypothetical protein